MPTCCTGSRATFAGDVPPQLRRDLTEFFAAGSASEQSTLSRSKAARVRRDLEALNRLAGLDHSSIRFGKSSGALARSELDDAKVGQPVPVKRILADDALDVLPVPARRHDDPAVSRDLPARDQKLPDA